MDPPLTLYFTRALRRALRFFPPLVFSFLLLFVVNHRAL